MQYPRKSLIYLVGIASLVMLAGCGGTVTVSSTATPAATATSAPTATATTPPTIPVKVYFSKNPDSLSDFSKVFPVDRTAPDLRVATFAMEQLIVGPTASEAAGGLFSQVKTAVAGAPAHGDDHCGTGITFSMTIPSAGVGRMQFCVATTSGGIGDDARIQAEINATLKQFSTITTVKICTADGDTFGNESGMKIPC